VPEPDLTVRLSETLLLVDDLLRHTEIPYAFGGAIALAYHVIQARGTTDLDVNLAAPAEASAALLSLLPDADWDDDTISHLEREGWVRVWLEGEIALDLFVPQHRFHDDLQAAVETAPFKGREIPIVSAMHLTVLKTMFGRGKDFIDIASMLEAGSVDGEVALAWTAELLGEDSPGHRRLAELIETTPLRDA